jgi:hypothetical protein
VCAQPAPRRDEVRVQTRRTKLYSSSRSHEAQREMCRNLAGSKDIICAAFRRPTSAKSPSVDGV